MDILPLIIAFIGGGALGTIITTVASARASKKARDDEAAKALWAYQAAVRGFSNYLFQRAGYGDEMAIPNIAKMTDVTRTQQEAFRFSGRLPVAARQLVREPQIEIEYGFGNELLGAESSRAIADQLEEALDKAFSGKSRPPRESRALRRSPTEGV